MKQFVIRKARKKGTKTRFHLCFSVASPEHLYDKKQPIFLDSLRRLPTIPMKVELFFVVCRKEKVRRNFIKTRNKRVADTRTVKIHVRY